jgi:hypothetical protein
MFDDLKFPKLPEVQFTKNGYQIRTEILEMAKELAQNEFKAKMHGWEISSQRDDKGNLVTEVTMPQFPGVEEVLKTAERLYTFVNCTPASLKSKK